MFQKFTDIMNFLWGTPLVLFVTAVGIFLTIRIGFFQFTHIRHTFRRTFGMFFGKTKEAPEGEGNMTPFQSLSAVSAGTIGAGNIAGIASAIAIGGPGAAFWMWIIALFGTAIKMAEVALAVKYRKKSDNGDFHGGPMYYIKEGLNNSKFSIVLAFIFAIGLTILVITDACFVQPNTLATSLEDVFNVPTIVSGIACCLIGILVVAGGLKGIGTFCGWMVPPMVLVYVIGTLGVIIANINAVPDAFVSIFKYAFAPAPAVGGFAGATVKLAMARGAARGIFSSECGEGTSCTVHATAITEHPVHQSLWGIIEVFLDTFFVSTLTALTVIVSGVISTGETGAVLTLEAFRTTWGSFGVIMLCLAIVLFAFSSYLGFFIEWKTCIVYLFGEKKAKFIQWFYFLPPLISAGLEIEVVWTLADASVGFVILPNLIGLIAVSGIFTKLVKDYKEKWKLS